MKKVLAYTIAGLLIAACGRNAAEPAATTAVAPKIYSKADAQKLLLGEWSKTATDADRTSQSVRFSDNGLLEVWSSNYAKNALDGSLSVNTQVKAEYAYKVLEGNKIELTAINQGQKAKMSRTVSFSVLSLPVSGSELTIPEFFMMGTPRGIVKSSLIVKK